MVKIEPKVNDKRKKVFNKWLKENTMVLVSQIDEETIRIENKCSKSVVVRKNIGGKKIVKRGETYDLEPGDDVEIEGKLFTVNFRPEE